MQEVTEIAVSQAGDWLEVLEQQVDEELRAAGELSRQPASLVGHRIAEGDLWVRVVHPPCRCWRCRGGVALSDRPVLDRLLGLHLSRLPSDERDYFIAGWSANPRHGREGRIQLAAWIRIAGGSQENEPAYSGSMA
ncbi:hypothetical protein CAL29_28160 [Bordetella genomosp. 10]|uniref:Uncharacterized protein n=1 Tax=Bordetella genomosp. 10 TaxID=1416804 RepID=A0A261S315_9BORD|nr:hypothetical protein [Bordetella genomosp. 10]OZI31748.1 hypothetical protein CAL29_28160 [Bordetella genomosp. 10]